MNMTKEELRIQECFEQAKKYSSRSEFDRKAKAEYCYLNKRKLLDKACAHMKLSPRYSYKRWTHETVLEEAKKYKSKSEFRRNNEGAYAYALSNGLLPQINLQMKGSGHYWHVFELMAVALKYDSLKDFMASESGAYNYALSIGMLKAATAHMKRSTITWTKNLVMDEAAKCKTKTEFFERFTGAYKHAERHGYWDEACSHMDVKKRKITKKDVAEIASRYRSKWEFASADSSAYSSAQKGGYLDEICAHMENKFRSIDREFVMSEAKKYSSRSHFKLMDPSCYAHAKRNGFLDEACDHMDIQPSGFKAKSKAILYHLRITGPDGLVLYKIGVTNKTAKSRIQSLYLNEGFEAEVLSEIDFLSGRDATIAEKRLHANLAPYRYVGDKIMRNGNTELFTSGYFDIEPT